MRGKGWLFWFSLASARITPAYAGKSHGENSGGCKRWDHPRLCGEKYFSIFIFLFLQGSPPPMRGKANVPSSDLRDTRITPAYAGKSVETDL